LCELRNEAITPDSIATIQSEDAQFAIAFSPLGAVHRNDNLSINSTSSGSDNPMNY
jgi:hypothetical protein